MKSKFVFIVSINVENSGITVSQMFETVSYHSRVRTDVSGYYANRAGGLSAPVKFFRPSLQMQIRN
jgi:hypothetical protein